jgi:hypothetical protein
MNHKTLARSDEQGEDPEGVGEAPPLQRDATFLQHAIDRVMFTVPTVRREAQLNAQRTIVEPEAKRHINYPEW